MICADIDREGVEATARALGGPTRALVVDAGRSGEIAALADRVKTDHARLDIALTTPATHVRKPMCDYTDEEYDRVADLNLRGTFYFLRAFARLMVAQGGASLIASSSVRATTLEPGLAIYGATKAGIIQMVRGSPPKWDVSACGSTRSCRASSRRRWSRRSRPGRMCCSALPARTVFDRWSEPRKVATAVAFLASDASYVTSTALLVDGGWTAIDGPPTGLTPTHTG